MPRRRRRRRPLDHQVRQPGADRHHQDREHAERRAGTASGGYDHRLAAARPGHERIEGGGDARGPAGVPERPSLEGLEQKWSAAWERAGSYRFDRDTPRERVYAIDTPPPTVSGSLHVGHVFS